MTDRQPTTRPRSYSKPTETRDKQPDNGEAWAALYTLLAEGLKHPDERFHRDVTEGRFADELIELTETLAIPLPNGSDALDTVPETRAAFDAEYIALFEGSNPPYAPLIESVYRPWYDGPSSDGLLSGPAAADMRARYDALGVSIPAAYAPDHLTLLLEYAALLCRAGETAAYVTLVEQHFDWLPALRRLTEGAAAEAPFHSYCVAVICETIAVVRDREGLQSPEPAAVESMCDRARKHVD